MKILSVPVPVVFSLVVFTTTTTTTTSVVAFLPPGPGPAISTFTTSPVTSPFSTRTVSSSSSTSSTSTLLQAEKQNLLQRAFGNKQKEQQQETGAAAAASASASAVLETTEVVVDGVEVGDEGEKEKELNPVEQAFKKIKDSGLAGTISLLIWEGAFWAISIPVAIFGYTQLTGEWPDLSDKEDLAKVGAEAFAFANVARLALPARIGLAIWTTPWVKENLVDRFVDTDNKTDEQQD